MTTDFDVIVLGLGPGGEEAAGSLAEAGRGVLGLDSGLVGGECPYYGCIPSKMILRGAELLGEARRVGSVAGRADVEPDFAPVAARIRDEATDNWDDTVAVDRLRGKGATVIRTAGRLVGRAEDGQLLLVADGVTYQAPRVVIATGTAPAVPPIDGLAQLRATGSGPDGPVWTNREAVKVTTVPPSLVVLGGGAIGCELAQGFARFGSSVTIVEAAPRLLMPEEPDASATIAQVFRREGIDVRVGVGASSVGPGGDGVEVTLADGSVVTGQKLLVAAGRRPNLHDIGLETIGLDPAARALTVDDRMRVLDAEDPVAGVYALGDITGRGAFTHVAVWQARALVSQWLERDEPFGGYHGLAWATFTDPEVGRVGMTEQQARDNGLRVRTGGEPIPSSSRGWIHGPGNDGFVKIVEDADRGVLVGATVVAPYGGELLGLLTLAVHAQVPVTELASMHYAFPTLHRAVLDAVRALG
ncbi:MAG: NAD(P)/FAD-dependent oxidoreductase [Actinomycetota bacterium]|nr:NAD(P)/FAD-dependent oxidoreductase [Actinomycetota bacterium]